MSDSFRFTYNKDVEETLFSGPAIRQVLDRAAFTIVGHAIPHVGVDTGALVNSLGHRIETVGGVAEAIIGSGTAAGVQPIWYAAPHMAGRTDPNVPAPRNVRPRPRRDHPTKQAPTTPFKKAMEELDIDYTVRPGGFEA